MTCPQCHKHIPAKAVWTASGLSGLTCPGCHASLSATPISAIIVFALSFGLANATLVLLRHRGAEFLLAVAGFFAVFAVVFALAAPVILRMRLKDHTGPHLSGNRA
jgi:hypothetical protein